MIQNQRVIWDDDGTNTDISTVVNNFRSGSSTIALVAADDYIYIASDLPFNHRYVKVSTGNAETSAVSAHIWWGKEWVAAVDMIDNTSSSGATLARDGVIQWKTNRLKGWDCEQDSEDVVTGLIGLYDMYWLRLTFSGDLSTDTAIQYIGHRFSSDEALYGKYPDLNNDNLKLSFQALKTDWDDQHFLAAEIIIRDLRKRSIIYSANQILDYEMFEDASIHQVAAIIYQGLGRSWDESQKEAERKYLDAMNIAYYNIDKNKDGNLSPVEKGCSTRWGHR